MALDHLIGMSRAGQLIDLPGDVSALENGDGAARDAVGEELG